LWATQVVAAEIEFDIGQEGVLRASHA